MALLSLLIAGVSLVLSAINSFITFRTHSNRFTDLLGLSIVIQLWLGLPMSCIALMQRGPRRFAMFAVCLNLCVLVTSICLAAYVIEFLD